MRRNETNGAVLAPFISRWPFLAAVALVSAAVSDVFVESIANTGLFGAVYFDRDDSSIVPSLSAAMVLAAYVIGLHVLAIVRRARRKHRDWLVDAASAVAAHAPWRDFPAIAAMQFAALFAMESVEQVFATGHLAGGAMWLGGPVIVSIAAHVAIGAVCTLVARCLLRRTVASFASLVSIALEYVLCLLGRSPAAAFVVRRDAASCSHAQPARVRHISGRAPPSFLAPA